MKKILFTILMSCLAFWGFAENRLYMEEQVFYSGVGNTMTINVYLEQDEETEISGMQMTLMLPNWLSIAVDEYGEPSIVPGAGRFVDHAIDAEFISGSGTQIDLVLYSPTAQAMNKPAGNLLFSFNVSVNRIPTKADIKYIEVNRIKASMQDDEFDATSVEINKSARINVLYHPDEYTLSLDSHEAALCVGTQTMLNALVTPDIIATGLKWEVVEGAGNVTIIPSDGQCIVRGESIGTAIVRVYPPFDPTTYDECVVTVYATPVSLNLDQHVLHMKAGETVQLRAVVLPEDACQEVSWSVTPASPVVTVDAEGRVNARQVGVATVVVRTIDGTGLSDNCTVNVELPDGHYIVVDEVTFPDDNFCSFMQDQPYVVDVDGEYRLYDSNAETVTSMDLSGQNISDPTGIEYFPNLTELDITGNDITGEIMDQLINDLPDLSATNDGVITVDRDDITSSQVQDLNDKGWTVIDGATGEVIPPFRRGDVNDDGEVDVVDAVAVINYIAGENYGVFIFRAADCDSDGVIDINDYVAIINIILSEDGEGAPRVMRAPAQNRLTVNDNLRVKVSTANAGESIPVEVSMLTSTAYTAFQMDVTLPAGMTLENATLNGALASSHNIVVSNINGKHRIIVYSLENEEIAVGEVQLLTMNLIAENSNSVTGVISVDGIVFSTKDEQKAQFDRVNAMAVTTGIDSVAGTLDRVTVSDGCLVIESATSGVATITSMNGVTRTVNVSAGANVISVDNGVYIVTISGKSIKVRL